MGTGLALVLATLGGAAAAAAPPVRGHELVWTRGPGAGACIDARELSAAIGARLGRPAFDLPGEHPVVIEGRIEPAGDGWRVTITIHAPGGAVRGTRELELTGGDCRALDEPLALVLALIVDPDGGGDVALVREPARDPTPSVRGEASVAAATAVGVLPGNGLGARAALAIDVPHLPPVAIRASWWAPELHDTGDGRGIWLERWQVGVALCTPAWRVRALGLAACSGGELGPLTARGVGFARTASTRSTVAAATVTGRATLDVGPRAFAAIDVGADVPVVRPQVTDGAATVLYRVPRAALIAALGVGVRF